MLRWKFVKFLMSILNWHFDSSSNFASFFNVLTENSPVNFKLIHFLLLIKWFYQSSNLNWTRWKFAKFLMTCLKAQVSFPSNVASIFSAIKQNSPILFFSSNIIYFVQKKPIKVQIFEIFECSGQNSSNSSCQFWTEKSILLQILHHSSLPWQKTPL